MSWAILLSINIIAFLILYQIWDRYRTLRRAKEAQR